jgi:type I restriction enzyme S subunit
MAVSSNNTAPMSATTSRGLGMSGEWREQALSDVLTLQRGFDLPEADRVFGNVPVVASTGIVGRHEEAKVCGPGVVIGRSGSIGGGQYILQDFWPLNTTLYVKDFKGNDVRFCYYALRSINFQQFNVGSGVPTLNRNHIASLTIPLPPLPEQRRIAKILGDLDDKIELNRKMNETLEQMARALFKSWFIDFDPVRAKMEGRQPPGMDAETAALFPSRLVESELGMVPEGWEATTLGACIGFRSGFSFKSQDWQEYGVPVVKIGSVKPGIIDLSQVSYVSKEVAEQAARYRLTTGDMLIGMTGYVGEVGLVPPSDNPPLLNQRVGKFVMQKPGTESLAFWYCTTRQPEFRTFVEARAHGTAQANVSGEAIIEFPLVAPSLEILDAFNNKCQPIIDNILTNHDQSRTLASLRDTLLPKLMRGEGG